MSRHAIARKSDFKVGRTLWLLQYGETVQVTVRSRVTKLAGPYIMPPVAFVYGMYYRYKVKEYEIYLGDCGVPGYAYDSRRPEVYTSQRAAKAALLQALMLHDRDLDYLRHA